MDAPCVLQDGQYLGALFTRVAQRHQRVHGLAGLRNGHHQRSGGEDRVTVAEFVGEFHFYRNAHPMLDGVFGHHARVRGRAAGDDDDLVDGFEIMLVDAHLIEVDVAVLVETPQQGALHGGRILVDLLVHEGVPAAFFGSRGIPIHGVGLRMFHDVAHEVGDDDLVCGHHHGLVLVDFHGALGVGHERGHVGAEEVLAFAKTDHQRRIVTGANHDVRLSHVRGENGERAFQHAGQTADGLEQVRLTGFLDDLVADFAQQFRRDLGIGFGDETIALRLQVETKLGSVFDDAVVDDGDLAVTRRVRMRVSVVRHAVRSPTRMADAHGGVRHRITFDVLHQVGQTSRPSYGRPHAPCQAPSAPRRPNHIRGIPIAEVLGDTPPKAWPHAVRTFPAYPTIPHIAHQCIGRICHLLTAKTTFTQPASGRTVVQDFRLRFGTQCTVSPFQHHTRVLIHRNTCRTRPCPCSRR